MKKVQWDILKLEFDNNILYIEPLQDMEYELEDLMKFHEFVMDFTEFSKTNERFLVLSDYRHHHLQLSNDLMKWAAKSEEMSKTKIAEAVLISSLPNRIIANFYIKF